jgi:hypothetical protein
MYTPLPLGYAIISILILASSLCNALYSIAEENPQTEKSIKIEFFMRAGCQNCAKAELYLEKLTKRHTAVEIEYMDVENDIEAAIRLNELAVKHG